MKSFNAELQSKFMVKNARYILFLGLLMSVNPLYKLFGISEMSGWFALLVGLPYVIGLIVVMVLMFINISNGPSTISQMINGYSDEYTYRLDKLGQSWALSSVMLLLTIQSLPFKGFLFEFNNFEIAKFNLLICFIIYGAKVTWEIRKDNKLEAESDE
jgi:hypothetical protein